MTGRLVAAGRLVGLVSAVTRKRPPRFASVSYVSNFLYNETSGYEMTNVIKASSHRRSGIPPRFFTMGNAYSLSFFLVLSSSSVRLFSLSLSTATSSFTPQRFQNNFLSRTACVS